MSDMCLRFRLGFAVLAITLSLNTPAHAQAPATSANAQTAAQSVANALAPAPSTPAWWQFRAEFRERMEATSAAGFTTGRDDIYWLSRLRLNATVTPTPWLSVHGQVQDARVGRKDVGSGGAPFSAPVDIRLAHADIGLPGRRLTARLGRQELAFGEQRLVGHVSWMNAARSFDAARVTIRAPGVVVDAFAGSVVRITTDDWDRSGGGSAFHGVYAAATTLIPGSSVEPYFFWRADRTVTLETGGTGRRRLATTGLRAAGALPAGFDYGIEAAVQSGSVGTDSTRAWAHHMKVRTPAFGRRLRLVSEYNFASGDENSTDGRRGTFDPLYPTPHDKYGLADQVGWRNIHHVRLGAEVGTIRGFPIVVGYHSWWLASARDGLYLASGAPLARIAAGAPGRHVGHELDVSASRSVTRQLQLAAGYSHIRPGTFLKAATPGSSFHSAHLMLTYVFLAER